MMVWRFNACKHNIRIMDEIGPMFLKNIVTEDETPLSLYIPFSRKESKEWILPGQKQANVLRHGTTLTNNNLYLLHDNAPVHKSNRTQEEIARLRFVKMEHPL